MHISARRYVLVHTCLLKDALDIAELAQLNVSEKELLSCQQGPAPETVEFPLPSSLKVNKRLRFYLRNVTSSRLREGDASDSYCNSMNISS